MTLYDQVKAVFDQAGVPPWIWYPIAIAESGGRPNAVGDNGTSFGLFQLHINGGQGTGYSPAQLADPILNAQIAAPAIANAWRAVQTDGKSQAEQLVEVMRLSGHPGNVSVSTAFTVAQSALSNFLGRGSIPAPEFGGIFKGGFFQGFSVPMLGVGNAMVPAVNWGTDSGQGVGSNVGFGLPGLGDPFAAFAGLDWTRIGVLALGVVLILLALAAFLWRPAVETVKAGAKVAAVA